MLKILAKLHTNILIDILINVYYNSLYLNLESSYTLKKIIDDGIYNFDIIVINTENFVSNFINNI